MTLLPLVIAIAVGPSPRDIEQRAMASLSQSLSSLGLARTEFFDDQEIGRLRQLKWSERRVIAILEQLFATCLAQEAHCNEGEIMPRAPLRVGRGKALLALLGRDGSNAAVPILWRLDARGIGDAKEARHHIHARQMATAIAKSPCRPPSLEEIARARADLNDFVVLRVREQSVVAEAPNPQERDDLAYFMAAVGEAGPEVGGVRRERASWLKRGRPDSRRDEAAQRIKAAKLRGDVVEIADAARAYLAHLGFPGPLRVADESEFTAGGARVSSVMRDLADADETLGAFDEAARLYREVDPGGGFCGTSVDWQATKQMEGLIRAEESAGRCRAVIAERLRAVRGGRDDDSYGPKRLQAAGFDVARLYRGALTTLLREVDERYLTEVIARADPAIAGPGLARLRARGPEAWENRVRALEAWADHHQRAAIPTLRSIALAKPIDPDGEERGLQRRALVALGALVQRSAIDPCASDPAETLGWFFLGELSEGHLIQHTVHTLSGCGNALSAAERDDLARPLLRLLDDRKWGIRILAGRTLSAIGSPIALHRLQELSAGNPRCAATRTCDGAANVRDAATKAVERIIAYERR